jgi:uncharacterized protein YfaS (alpha-2-macroglobulin family)
VLLVQCAVQRSAADAAAARVATLDSPLAQALLLLSKRAPADKAVSVLNVVRTNLPTLDRAQALMWLQRALGARPQDKTEVASMPAPWQRVHSVHGATAWQLPAGAAVPNTITLPAEAKAAWAFVSYESAEAQAPGLPVQLERTLWRVVPVPHGPEKSASKSGLALPSESAGLTVKLEQVSPGTPLNTNSLYLDQLSVTAQRGMRWALLEAALPPGAAVETSTWGINIDANGKVQTLERAQHQLNAQGYAVPLETLAAGKTEVVRHLVRFSQRGQFKLPPVRLYRMYEPEAKAIDTSAHWASVEVR